MLRILSCLVFLWSVTSTSWALDENAKRILARFDAIRPDADELAMYRLDWAASIDTALQRAAAEGRPVFLVVIHAKYGDVASGHC